MRLDLQLLRRSLSDGKASVAGQEAGFARSAAVAAIVRPSEAGAELLLIRRARDERDPWSGHMALPGGHREQGDLDLVATALRETHEEVGLLLDRDGEWLGTLERAQAIGGRGAAFEIVPLVFALARTVADAELVPNPREVDSIVWARLEDLLLPAAHTHFTHAHGVGQAQQFPAFDVKGHVVWGLTYRILRNLLQVWGHVAPAPGDDKAR
jgi:8-oxo-dGTP pyrophosphatase MutT (NUDIX family)